jgi:hypothetical protein
MIRLTQILVATDFSDPSDAALNCGREVTRALGARLRVPHVVQDLSAMVGPEGYITTTLPEMQRELEEARRTLSSTSDISSWAASPRKSGGWRHARCSPSNILSTSASYRMHSKPTSRDVAVLSLIVGESGTAS